jgi:hypothetical protein
LLEEETMKLKRRHVKKGLRAISKFAKRSRPVVAAVVPVVIEVVADTVPGGAAIKIAAKVAKEL